MLNYTLLGKSYMDRGKSLNNFAQRFDSAIRHSYRANLPFVDKTISTLLWV